MFDRSRKLEMIHYISILFSRKKFRMVKLFTQGYMSFY